MNIWLVNTSDARGGAEGVTRELLQAYRARGHGVRLVVGFKRAADEDVLALDSDRYRNAWVRMWKAALSPAVGRVRGAGRLRMALQMVGQPRRTLATWLGVEDFDFPAAHRLLEQGGPKPHILHCNNLHGGFFDLRALVGLSRRVSVVLRLSDMWLLTGHCAHSFDCERWETGCGECPDLSIPPAIQRDATRRNWQRKKEIFAESRLYVSTPSKWLMDRVERSILAPAAVDRRIIPNGVNLSVFRPRDRQQSRARLGLPQHARVLLFAANGIRRNVWKDYRTLRAAVALAAERRREESVLFVALGEDAPPERVGAAEVRFVPYQEEPHSVADYYRAADVYLHAARADTFPNTVLEALACGTPVVATAVGGIPEQVRSFASVKGHAEFRSAPPQLATGFLAPPGEPRAMAECILQLLRDDSLRRQLGENAARDARERFDLNRQAEDYLAWYRDIVEARAQEPGVAV